MEKVDIQTIMQCIPHRYPFLLVDRVLQYQKGVALTGLKNVTVNEPFFNGHFPGRPIMPGVLIIEALAQATGILAILTAGFDRNDNSLYFLAGVDNARFKQPVVPGDQLILDVRVTRNMRSMWKFDAEAKVDGKVVSSAELMCVVKENDA